MTFFTELDDVWQWIGVVVSISTLFLTSWVCYRRVADLNALNTAQQTYGKSKIRRMGTLSELWQILYETYSSPTIHAFEYGPDSGYHLLKEFWLSFSKKYKNWRCVPVKVNNRWFWREIDDKDFNIEHHCKHIILKSNGNTQKAIVNWMNNNNMNRPFDPNKPHWETYYIQFDDSNEAYGYGRIHHSIGDGVLLNRICEMEHNVLWNKNNHNTTDNESKSKQITSEKLNVKIKNKKTDFYNKIMNATKAFFHLIRYTPFCIYDLVSLFFESAPLHCGIHPNYYTNINKSDMKNRKFNIVVSDKFVLKDIKILCKKYGNGYTINDFVLTVFCEAVYKYIFKYVAHNNECEYAKITNKYGNKLYLRFFTVFNMRSLIDKDLEKLSQVYAKGLSENSISTVPIRLPCGNMSFIDRFNEIHELFHKLKNSISPIITALVLQIGNFLFGLKFVNLILGRFTASKCTFTLSNLVGPKKPLVSGPQNNGTNNYVWNMFNGTNPSHTPLSCGIMSYVDYITFTLIADQNSISNPNKFMDCLNDAYINSFNK
eukprot:129790_1